MDTFSCRETAEAYAEISEINPPAPAEPGWYEFGDLALLRSVDPRQHDYLAAISRSQGAGSEWEKVRQAVEDQREIRRKLYNWIRNLDCRFQRSPSDFVFPDPYSLLLWIWTFQLFNNVYAREPGEAWKKYFYRGEPKDYGTTRFLPKSARPEFSKFTRDRLVPARVRELLRRYLSKNQAWKNAEIEEKVGMYFIETMSCAQALAVAQHYGYPTPLLDVTTHPEIALYFATLSSEEETGFVGYWDSSETGDIHMGKNLSLITVPPLFSRIRLQSGYFICTSGDTSNLKTPLRPLRFRHCPEVEPLRPTWAMSVGPIQKDRYDPHMIVADPLNLECQLKSGLPEAPPEVHYPDPNIIRKMEKSVLLKYAVTDFLAAAGRQGVTASGKRFAVLQPTLLYSILRNAPVHGHIYAATLIAASEVSETFFFREISKVLLNVLRAIIVAGLMKYYPSRTVVENIVRGYDTKTVMQICWNAIGRDDPHLLPSPLSSWYQ